jgi:predicted alpha/beta superfamily hydrolase
MKLFFAFLFCIIPALPCFAQKTNKIKPFVLGHETEFKSAILGEKRILNISLPEGYNAKDTVRYPVIYLLDGSANEDFIHISGLVQYSSFEWVNYIPKSIVVGIATINRRRDFTFPSTVEEQTKAYPEAGHSDKFIAFIEKELQPFIERYYHTNASKTIIGQSLGGLLETEILFKKPELFNRYIIVSPSLWWDNGSLLNLNPKILSSETSTPISIYIGVGKEGLAPTVQPHVMEVDANLLAEKIKTAKSKSIKVMFDYLPAEDHGTILHQAVLNAFKSSVK